MKFRALIFAAVLLPLPALSQDAVNPAELAQLKAQHPDWAWLDDPKLAQLVLAGPRLPNSEWRVHDIRRPQPRAIDTGSGICGTPAPAGAEILFDGRDLSKWTGDKMEEWTLHDGTLTTGGRVYNFLKTKESFGDIDLHVEFKEPVTAAPPVNPQYRGNSGVFPMGLYEIQILDSYRSATYPDGTVGGIYGQSPPLMNAARPPGVWQCFDITFRAPRFSGTTVSAPARVSVKLNGVLVQHDTALIGATVHGKVGVYAPHAAELPLALQGHGNADSHVSFRNIWVRRL